MIHQCSSDSVKCEYDSKYGYWGVNLGWESFELKYCPECGMKLPAHIVTPDG
jgi:hypothetical protein